MSTTAAPAPGRARILDAALDLLTQRGGAAVSIAEIARAAQLSRQAVYLHFADRADLLAAVARYVDERSGLADDFRRVVEAPSGVAALREWVAVHARTNPEIWPVARVFDALRRADPAVARSWQERLERRLDAVRQVVMRLREEGALRAGVELGAAADLAWTLTSLHVWEDLVVVRGWSEERYRRYITTLVVGTLTS
ncbi:MAG TPA: TetR/AcrR family transcriptional regulator [Gemmatimonadales bacterium]|nr:TetR/AcrR family transcriptional regulator [Gemmatimonadales bacterium]